jgi:hypothetical protein
MESDMPQAANAFEELLKGQFAAPKVMLNID